MIYLYLLYGVAFIASGLILGLQARLSSPVLPRGALAWLAGFALLHGVAEWTVMWQLIEHGGRAPPNARIALVFMLALSFGLLLQFGAELLVTMGKRPGWIRPGAATVTIVLASTAAWIASADGGPTTPLEVEALVRYSLGLGASLLAAHGLLLVRRVSWRTLTARSRRLLLGASITFAVYGVLAGMIVPAAPFFPASHVNAESVRALIGVPIELLRGLCAVALAGILSEIFVIETSRARAELTRLREEFISVVAHDLRSPISTIQLAAGLMESKLADDQAGADLRRHLERIRTSGHRLDRMISDLLDASRVEARQLSLSPKLTDMRALILGTTDRAAAVCGGHPVRVQLPDQLPSLTIDPSRVEQVLTNLLSNAGKYAREGSEIVVGATVEPPHLEVAVSNLGEGISAKEAEQIFTRFYRAKGAARRAEGIGVGLYIARGLVEAHGGTIWVESDGGQTTFRLRLPLTAPYDEGRRDEPTSASQIAPMLE